MKYKLSRPWNENADDLIFEYLQLCVGQQSCTVPVTPEIFGGDPCAKVMKKLSVEAICSWVWFKKIVKGGKLQEPQCSFVWIYFKFLYSI